MLKIVNLSIESFLFERYRIVTATVCAKNFHNALMYVIQFVYAHRCSYDTTFLKIKMIQCLSKQLCLNFVYMMLVTFSPWRTYLGTSVSLIVFVWMLLWNWRIDNDFSVSEFSEFHLLIASGKNDIYMHRTYL